MNLREVFIGEEHPWVGEAIRNLDISRQELIVSIERKGKMLIPSGGSEIRKGDVVLLYRKGANIGKSRQDAPLRRKTKK